MSQGHSQLETITETVSNSEEGLPMLNTGLNYLKYISEEFVDHPQVTYVSLSHNLRLGIKSK